MKKEKYGLQFGCEKDKKRANKVIGNAGEVPAEGCFGGKKMRLSRLGFLSFA